MSQLVVLKQMLVIVILISVGFVFAKAGKLSERTSKDLSFLVISVCNPAMIIMGALGADQTTRKELLITAGLAVASFAVVIALGAVLPALFGAKRDVRKYYNMLFVYGNYGFIGLPVVSAVLGEEALIYVSVFVLFFNLLIYTHGIYVIGGGKEHSGGIWQSLRRMVNAGTVSGIIAVILVWFDLKLPDVLADSLTHMGKSVTFLSLLIVGISLAGMKLSTVFTDARLYALYAIRMLVLPILSVFVMKHLINDRLLLSAVALILSMPSANMPLMMASDAGGDTKVLSRGIVLSTFLSILTVPIVAGFV